MHSLKRLVAVALFLLLILLYFPTAVAEAQNRIGSELTTPILESINPLIDVILPRMYPVIAADVSAALGDATLINRINFVVALGMVDAAAPYHETAVGMYSRIPRQEPAARSNRNINTAMMHAAYQALMSLLPDRAPIWREMLQDYGLNPADDSREQNSAVGIGNSAGAAAVAGRYHDGMNQAGKYQDTTGYMPVNSAFVLRDASRWQPGLRRNGVGIYTVQHFVTPQLANVEPFARFDPRSFRLPPPAASNVENWEAYKGQADEALDTMANLTDEQKILAEIFDNKILSLGQSYTHLARELGLSPADTARGYFVKTAAALDGSIVIWQEKARYDAVRPFSAIRHVYGDDLVRTWGGPGAGTVEIPASAWQAYLPEADHPEYPSGSTCGCYATAQALRRFAGSDALNWTVSYPAGASRIEPGITPARDLSFTFETWTDFAESCGQSRQWGGVHFRAAVEESASLCRSFGDMAYEAYTELLNGSAALREPAQPLSPDPWLAQAAQSRAQAIVVPLAQTPTPEACEMVSETIVVTSMTSGIQCQALANQPSGLFAGYLDAVDIRGVLETGAQVCFRDRGEILYLETGGAAPVFRNLASYQVAGMTCSWLERPGLVMLVAAAAPPAAADTSAAASANAGELESCRVTTRELLNFRPRPASERAKGLIPEGTTVRALEREGNWFRVLYEDAVGWISGDFVETDGGCG